MEKNQVIAFLSIIIIVLVGIVLVTNSDWFSEQWLIGLGMILAGGGGGGFYIYKKVMG